MGRPRREIYSGQVYEICLRTRYGLPFVYSLYMEMLIRSCLARIQRDSKVSLCHFLWMANHVHMLVVAKDRQACHQFYGELQKQLTESIKRLLGVPFLSLWKKNAASVIALHDIDTISYRIAYFYANPARAHLADTISDYIGVSSYSQFLEGKENLLARHSQDCPWVRAPLIEQLPHPAVSRSEDLRIVAEWKKLAEDSHEFVVEPNAWMKQFGIKEPAEVRKTNQNIFRLLTGLEEEARASRIKSKKKVAGRKSLRSRALTLDYTPTKPSRRITVYSLDPELRMHLIQKYKDFCYRCRQCYEEWKRGNFSVVWPAGAYLPSRPHTANYLTEGLKAVC